MYVMQFFKMKQIFFYIIVLVILYSCFSNSAKVDSDKKDLPVLIDNKLVILKDTKNLQYVMADTVSDIRSLNAADLARIDSILNVAVNNGEFDFLQDPKMKRIKNYYRQYICFQDKKGEKIVFINAFCEIWKFSVVKDGKTKIDTFDWKNEFLIVYDGGACYWNIKVNLTTNQYFDLFIN